jgi:hypothetical protein
MTKSMLGLRILTFLGMLAALPTALCSGQTRGIGAPEQSNTFPARLETTNYKGWNAYRLTNGLVTLTVVPDIGGRAIQLQIGEKELFFVNPVFAGKVLP